jgi:hypothetical protein
VAKPLNLKNLLTEDQLATGISEKYLTWETFRAERARLWRETLEYIFATDTTMTSNSKLPWSNKTTIPKLCQIRDNLHANYMATMFPKRKWLRWEGSTADDESREKVESIESYMSWCVDQNHFYNTMSRLVYDFIDYGNVVVMPEWIDESNRTNEQEQTGFVGPAPFRISPLDIVFDPTVVSFERSPKIVRSVVSLGEVKEILEAASATEEDRLWAEETYRYLREIREVASESRVPSTTTAIKDRIYQISGFNSFQDYLCTDDVEILTFYGDIYDRDTDTLLKNHVIKIVDRHKIIYKAPNMSSFGTPAIYHAGWRLNQDNLWAHSPLENLVGMQYRIDHLENMKADVFDLIAYPPLKIKGYVEDFEWGPMERIYVGDDGDVMMLSPDVNALQADTQIAILEAKMEEMAGSPKEAAGFRTPGEKTKYEVQSLENAASRIFQNKIAYFERHITENILNAMLELARRNMTEQVIRVLDDEFKIGAFLELTAKDITGSGRIKPIAARHFAEKAQTVQNITAFFNSAAGQDQLVIQHFSAEKLAKMWENVLEIEEYKIVQPYIRLTETADAQRLQNTQQEQVMTEQQTASGMNGDFDLDVLQEAPTTA